MDVPRDNPRLLEAQYRAFSKQLPLMYFMLLASTWAVALTSMNVAPQWLTLYVPAVLTLGCMVRIVLWIRGGRKTPSYEHALAALNGTNRLAIPLAMAYAGWALAIFPYGDAYMRSHVAFYMAITVIGCIFCLMHLRPAAFKVALIVNVAFVAFFGATGNATFVAMAVNVVLVSGIMLLILQVNYRDFTSKVEAQAAAEALSSENARLANIDSLTDLSNRRRFFAELEKRFRSAEARGARCAVGLIDLDRFKQVNDLYGHAAGDGLLVQVGSRLADLCPGDVHLSRLGGDEFALIIDGYSDEALLMLGGHMCAGLSLPFVLSEATVQIAGSVGFAVYPEMAASATDLFERADYALYHAKHARRGCPVLFSAEHEADIGRKAAVEHALQGADLEREFSVVFQPIVDVRSQRTCAFEALARWSHPKLGAVPPQVFIPIAERTGLITRLTRILLPMALAAARNWPDGIRLSFNLSAHDLSAPEDVLKLVLIINESGFDPTRLDLEITETALMQDRDQVVEAAQLLRSLGCGLVLDDFGTGFSSLTQLHALPLTKIKIDRSFVHRIDTDQASYKIVKSLLALSRDMDLGCIVEGVEHEHQLDVLRRLGGRLIQGYLFSPPMGTGDLPRYIEAVASGPRARQALRA